MPGRTYFYGHSAGARIGRGINYTPGLNQGRDGKPMFDGILAENQDQATAAIRAHIDAVMVELFAFARENPEPFADGRTLEEQSFPFG